MIQAALGPDPFRDLGSAGTDVVQPAIFAASQLAWQSIEHVAVDAVVGHSLGEIGALVAAGALPCDAGLELVVERGRVFQAAIEGIDGGMMAVSPRVGVDIEGLSVRHGVFIACDNADDQVVIAGKMQGLSKLEADLSILGVRVRDLRVAGPFHTPLMESALEGYARALSRVSFRDPDVLVLSSISLAPFTAANAVDNLLSAVTARVRWREALIELRRAGISKLLAVS